MTFLFPDINLSANENRVRLAGIALAIMGLGFAIESMKQRETEDEHHYYDLANTLVGGVAFLNNAARMMDHWYHNPEKKIEIACGVLSLGVLTAQIVLTGLSASSSVALPVVIPVLLTCVNSLLGAGLNWESANSLKEAIQNNWARIASGTLSVGGCSTSMVNYFQNNKSDNTPTPLFYASGSLSNGAKALEAWARLRDILFLHGDETSFANKVFAGGNFATVAIGSLVSGLAAFKVLSNVPLVFAAVMNLLHYFVYQIAQWAPKKAGEAAATEGQPFVSQVPASLNT